MYMYGQCSTPADPSWLALVGQATTWQKKPPLGQQKMLTLIKSKLAFSLNDNYNVSKKTCLVMHFMLNCFRDISNTLFPETGTCDGRTDPNKNCMDSRFLTTFHTFQHSRFPETRQPLHIQRNDNGPCPNLEPLSSVAKWANKVHTV
jgi:hypothetical protein